MPGIDVVMPVGPGTAEPRRARDALESLLAYESEVGRIVLIDDGPSLRGLVEVAVPPAGRTRAVALANPRAGRGAAVYGGLCAAVATGLAWLYERGEAELVLRMDADALVIAPFSELVARAVAADRSIGMTGSCELAPTGVQRDFGAWTTTLRKLERPVWLYRNAPPGTPRVRLAWRGQAGRVRGQLRTANANGYRPGEHCLGAACVLTRELVVRMHAAGYLDDELTWLGTWCTDDVMLGVQTRAVGMRLHGMTGRGEPFGVAQLRLPGPPEWLVEQGYALIHAVKSEAGVDEAAVRDWFRARRES